jgi:hypothetical protein
MISSWEDPCATASCAGGDWGNEHENKCSNNGGRVTGIGTSITKKRREERQWHGSINIPAHSPNLPGIAWLSAQRSLVLAVARQLYSTVSWSEPWTIIG